MGNDEKAHSRKDETPTPADNEDKIGLRVAGEDPSPLPFMDDDDGDKPAPGARSGSGGLEADIGMPAFGFFHDALKQAKKVDKPVNDALDAAKAGLDNPQDGTGWDAIQSIAPAPNTPNGSTPFEPSFDDDDAGPLLGMQAEQERAPATVMPFPGGVLHRPAEPAPSEMLGALAEGRDANLFDSAPEETPDQDEPGNDTIADAVQSALRNVYGGAMTQPEEELPDFDSITVADSLKQAAAQSSENEDFWSDRAGQWSGEQQDDEFAGGKQETDTDAVLDYLYGERRSRQQPYMSGESSLRDLNESMGYEREPRGRFDADDREDLGSPGPARGYEEPLPFVSSRQYSDRGQRGFPGESAYHEPTVEPEWGPQPYVTTSAGPRIQEPQYPAPIASTDSLASGSPDSSHLLGAAGLGLIGGIALAGVLAVFAFNSINVDDGEPRAIAESSAPPKVIERLGGDDPEPEPQRVEAPQPEPEPQRAETPAPRTEASLDRAIQQPEPRPITRSEPEVQAAVPQAVERIAPPAAPAPPARLTAEDAAGDPGEAIPLDIVIAKPEDREATLISLKGLPVSAKLSTGIDVGGGQWLLPPAKLGNLTVTTAPNVEGRFNIEAELLKDDAQTAIFGPVAFTLHVGNPPPQQRSEADTTGGEVRAASASDADPIISPSASDRGAQVASLAESSEAENDFLTQMLIRDGNKLMREGDIMAARRLYEQAAANGNPEAALAMGRSFDPSYFEKLPVKTGKPDPATAFEWYKKALDGGLVTARVKIDGLKQWLQR